MITRQMEDQKGYDEMGMTCKKIICSRSRLIMELRTYTSARYIKTVKLLLFVF